MLSGIKVNFNVFIFFMTIITLYGQRQQQNMIFFSNSFETKESIKKEFRLDKILKNAWSLAANDKTDGNFSLRITLNKGDNASGQTERAEFQDANKLALNQEVWYRLDFKIPDDFPEIDQRTVIWQLKQDGGNNPLISMRFRNGKLSIKQRFSFHQIVYKPSDSLEITKNKWHCLVMQTYLSKSDDGYINVYLNNQLIISYVGQTAYTSQESRSYFKFGLYRDQTEQPMTLFFDNYKRGTSWKEVAPTSDYEAIIKGNLWRHEIEGFNTE